MVRAGGLTAPATPAPTFFDTPAAFGAWLERHHANRTALLVGFHKVGSGRPCMSWPESVDEALCFGWIDGVRKRIDDSAYTIRFSPRKPGSIWSTVNQKRVAELTAAGRMRPAGLAAFARRTKARSGVYAYEQADGTEDRADAGTENGVVRDTAGGADSGTAGRAAGGVSGVRLDPAFEAEFRADPVAWAYFEAQAAWYRKRSIWRVISAKREETRRKRLATLIDASRRGERWG